MYTYAIRRMRTVAVFTLALVADSWCCDAGAVEVTLAVNVTLHTTQHQSGRVRSPTQRALALKKWTATALALTTFIITSKKEEDNQA